MKKVILAVSFIFLSACTSWQVTKETVRENGARASDEALRVNAWTICNATPRGAIVRKFNTPDKEKILKDFCQLFKVE